MFGMINSFFSMLTTLFSAGEKAATSLDILADVSVDTATGYRDNRRAEMAKQLEVMEEE